MLHYAMPTPQHQLLDRMAGSWTVVLRYQAFPDTEAVETTGHAERRWILGGRFLMEELDGGNLALPMQGLGLFGFDVFEQKHSSVWLDTMNTAILSNLGTYDPINELVSFAGDYKDPWTGTKKKERGVLRLMGRDRQVLEIHVSGTNGVEFKMIELAYTRKVAPPKIR